MANRQNKKSNQRLFKELLRDPDRKSLFRMTYELIVSAYLNTGNFRYIISAGTYLKSSTTNYKDFVPNKFAGKISVLINDHKSKEVLDNKLFFNFFYSQFDINLPKILLYNHKKHVYY